MQQATPLGGAACVAPSRPRAAITLAGRRVRRLDRHRGPGVGGPEQRGTRRLRARRPSRQRLGRYTGPPVTIEYSIWGDPAEINSQKAVVEALHRGQPGHHGRRDRGRLGRLLGQAPDRPRRRRRARRVRHGRPARPRLPGAATCCSTSSRSSTPRATTSASSTTTRSRTSRPRDGVMFGLPRDLNVIALYYNKDHVRRGRDPVPGRHLGLGQARSRSASS